jgi:alpha-tubulin suppressor-like RCC1 family protein
VPVQVNLSPASGIKQLVASISTAIYVLDNDGNIWSWGANYAGQMGNGGTTSVTTPAMLSVSDGDTAVYFTDVAASNFAAAYALDTDGNIWVWGYGANYSLENNATANVLAPVKLTVTDDDGSAVTFTDVNAGRSGYATDTSGNVWAWGLNNYGWFGDGTTDTRTVPSKLTLPADTATIYYGPMNLFVTDTSGDVWVSGSNSGQLGTGNYVNSSVFIKHDQLSAMDIEFINLGDSCAYMVDSAGDLWTAGSNTYGAQGNNTKVNTKTFLQVTNVTAPTARQTLPPPRRRWKPAPPPSG